MSACACFPRSSTSIQIVFPMRHQRLYAASVRSERKLQASRHDHARRGDEAAAFVQPSRRVLGPDLEVQRVDALDAKLGLQEPEGRRFAVAVALTKRELAQVRRWDPDVREPFVEP